MPGYLELNFSLFTLCLLNIECKKIESKKTAYPVKGKPE